MEWMLGEPRKTGYYWVRYQPHDGNGMDAEIVWIHTSESRLVAHWCPEMTGYSTSYVQDLYRDGWRFAGPLERPSV